MGMSDGKSEDTASTPVSEYDRRTTADSSLKATEQPEAVIKRKKPIAAWRLAVMFAWYVSRSR